MKYPTPQAFLSAIAPIAVECEHLYDIPAAMIIAQSAIETGWGQRPIGEWNFFGMKSRPHTLTCTVPTREVWNQNTISSFIHKGYQVQVGSERADKPGYYNCTISLPFADYPSLRDATVDYCLVLTDPTGPYKNAYRDYKNTHNTDQFIQSVGQVYATDPQYGLVVKSIAHQQNIRNAIANAAQKEL